ncbi:hypothetical protein L596_028209 [Steinernema carpocapsae]|uniref:C-type lectin domain-containing protein n=1 Tax=Steinernema carpocapsae TaxID=34508 RepID=A0A4U5LXU7_STECR|nr:hypothetical protein L596_028209 [Steinernema carpocapsae]
MQDKNDYKWVVPSSTGYSNWKDDQPKNEQGAEFFVVLVNWLGWERLWADANADLIYAGMIGYIACMAEAYLYL